MLHGAQLWVALPENARHCEHPFILHGPAPIRDSPGLRARVFLGRMGSTVAPAAGVVALVRVELSTQSRHRRAGNVPLDPAFEHLIVPLVGTIQVCGEDVRRGQAIYLGTDRENVDLELSSEARVLLLGGLPFDEEIVGRTSSHGRTRRSSRRASSGMLAATAGSATYRTTRGRSASEPQSCPP